MSEDRVRMARRDDDLAGVVLAELFLDIADEAAIAYAEIELEDDDVIVAVIECEGFDARSGLNADRGGEGIGEIVGAAIVETVAEEADARGVGAKGGADGGAEDRLGDAGAEAPRFDLLRLPEKAVGAAYSRSQCAGPSGMRSGSLQATSVARARSARRGEIRGMSR